MFDEADNMAIGESTVLYLYFYEEAIKNIKKYLGENVKIIIMLRNPIDRAYSAFSFASRTHQENQNFRQALMNSLERYNNDETLSPMILYKELGMYYKMVEAYMQNFKDVHLVIYDDFISQTDLEVRRVFDFLNISTTYNVCTDNIINSGGRKWDSRVIKDLLMSEIGLKKILRILLPKKIRINIKLFLINIFTSQADDINELTKKELLDYYDRDIKSLEQLINRDLSKWMKI